MARPFKYHQDEERPVTVSFVMPRDLYNQMEEYRRIYRQSRTEIILDAIRLRLETPADPRDIIIPEDNIIIEQLQEMVDARVQAALERLTAVLSTSTLAQDTPSEPVSEP